MDATPHRAAGAAFSFTAEPTPVQRWAGAAATWACASAAAWALDGQADLGSQALPLVLAAAASGLWLPMPVVGLACTLAVLGFNWQFVEPRGSLHVELHRDALLLGVMLAVSLGVAALMTRQRRLAQAAQAQAQRVSQLLALAEALRQADTPVHMHHALATALTALGLPVPQPWPTLTPVPDAPGLFSADEASGLRQCAEQAQAFGPGTGRFEGLPAWYLPLRSAGPAAGAVLLRLGHTPPPAWLAQRAQAQALCDLAGQALGRHTAQQQAEQARQHAQVAQWRTTWLAAIAHDLRTPLAAVLGAASSLQDQAQRLDGAQRQQLARRIVDEVSHLVRVTDNALQLARLDGPRPSAHPPRLHMDWQSPEELVGAVLHRLRQRQPDAVLHAELPPALPLVRCDAVLIVQLLENLLDNALRHSPAQAPVTVSARTEPAEPATAPAWLLLRVRDHGPGLPAAEQARFRPQGAPGIQPEVPADVAAPTAMPSTLARRRGSGLGLALCLAIAQEHGGQLRHLAPADGGACFELRLPCEPPPALPLES